MGRHKKVDPHFILEKINGKNVTKAALSKEFKVCKDTIGNYIKTLVKEKNKIIHGPNGYVAISKEWLDNPENADQLKCFQSLGMAIFDSWAMWMGPVRPLFPHMRKVLMENTTPEERRNMLAISAKITALLAISVEGEDE